jgi:ABC-2 type transport system permease protein
MRGMITVFWHELADNFSSWRFMIISGLVLLAGTFTIYVAANNISAEVTDVTTNKYYYAVPDLIRFVFLRLYTTPSDILNFSFLSFIVFFVPIVGISLGFDAINGEKNSGTLSRLLSLPIFRDAVINGKFLAGVVTMAVMLVSIVMLVAGVGLMKLGVFPSPEEVIRLMAFLALSIVYGAFWLGLAMLFSIFFRRVATSALASIAIWIFVIFFMYMFASLIANMTSKRLPRTYSGINRLRLTLCIYLPVRCLRKPRISFLPRNQGRWHKHFRLRCRIYRRGCYPAASR